MKKILFILTIFSIMLLAACSKTSNSNIVSSSKTFKDIIGTFSNTGFNVGNILITDGAVNISKSVSNYGIINIILELSPSQMQNNSSTTLTYNNVLGIVGSIATTFPSVSLKITEREYDETHDYTGDESTYTQIDCTITYMHNGKTISEDFVVHNAECCSVGNTMRSLFGR